MSPRRAARGMKVAHPAAPTSNRLLSTQTFTLIASWKGQLVICTVVLVVGAIYFVVREPIREWRERQRERMSRAFTEELLSMEKKEEGNVGSGDRNRAGPSTVAGTSTAVATAKTMNARERGREKRKEKKRKEQNANGHAAPRTTLEPGPSSKPSLSDQSPVRVAETLPGPSTPSTADTRDASMTVTPASCPSSMGPQPSTSTSNAINDVAADPSSPPPQVRSELEVDTSPIVDPPASPETMKPHSPNPPLSPRKTHTSEHQPEPSYPGTPERRDSHSSSRSRSYSIIPDPSYLPPHHSDSHSKQKKKRKPKSRQASAQQPPQQPPSAQQKPCPTAQATPMSRIVTTSSEDVPRDSPRTPMIPIMSPDIARRRMKASGIELPPEVEVLLDSHEHTIDSLRAEIGRATAEECKARDDEVRAREELRRSRATEDRMRSDYERARKMRDRAEQEARRMEGEVQMIWNRFETLSHMYQAVCQRLREVEAAQQADGTSPTGPTTPAPPQLPQLQPLMAFANGIPATPGVLLPYHMVPSPLTPHGFGIPPTMYRRGDSASSEMLAGPLTPGHQPSTPSGTSSPYPSDLSLNPGSKTHTESSSMTTAELRRISIASSVLKKKKPSPSESGESSAPSATATSSDDKSSSGVSGVEGLGIRTYKDVPSSFSIAMTPAKQRSTDSVDCSTASSSPPAERHILITPSESEHNGEHSPQMSPLLNGHQEEELTPPKLPLVDEPQALDDVADVAAEPMFASLAHTPEQLAEIARMRQSAIRDRERKSRAASVEVHDHPKQKVNDK